MARKPTAQALIKKLKAKGKLDLYWFGKTMIGVRTLYWVDDETVGIGYEHTLPALTRLPLEKFLRNIIRDNEAHANWWLAYGARLRGQKE